MTSGTDRPQSSEIWVEATPGRQRVEPGERTVFAVAVENRSGSAQSQALRVEGLPAGWATVDFASRAVAFPQERRLGSVTVNVPLDADAGEREFEIVAEAGAEQGTAELILEILPLRTQILAPGLTMTPSTLEVEPGGAEVRIQLDVRNVGAQATTFAATVDGLEAGWSRIEPELQVGPGSTVRHELWVRAPASARQSSHPFTVRVATVDDPSVLTEAIGELRVSVPERDEPEEELERQQPDRISHSRQPDVTQTTTIDLPEEQGAVRAPDVSLAPTTRFRFGAERVSDQALIMVQNRSRITERYTIEVVGLPDSWYTLTATDVSLEAGLTQQVPLRLSPRPGAEQPAGEYQFAVRVEPRGYPASAAEIPALLIIEGTEDFRFELEPPQASGRTVSYELVVRSTGSRSIRLTASASDLEGRCKFRLPEIPELGPDEEVRLPVVVGARRNRFVGSPETFDFRLALRREQAEEREAKSFDARFVHRPFVSPRIPALVAFYAFMIAIVAFTIFWAPTHVEGLVEWGGCQIHEGPECDGDAQAVAEPTPTPTATPTTPPTSTPTGTPALVALACTNDPGQRSQVPGLAVGVKAYADDRSNIRSNPAVVSDGDNRVGQVRLEELPESDHLAARTMQVIGGPFCGSDFIWWQIRSDFYGIESGWIVEVDGDGEVNLDIAP